MDPANTSLGRLLLKEITPVVMVLSTPLAEEACQKNGLSFVQMLAPFCLFNKIDVPVRTASDQPYRLQMFKLRMVYASDIHQTNYEAAEDHLKRVVSDASENALSDLQSDPPQLLALSSMERESYLSWFFTFNEELIKTLSFSEHEAFDHPVACLLVVSSRDEEPTNRFVDLFNTGQLPSPLNEGAMDPKILKHYLLLHDKQEDTTEKAINILAEMRNTFGLNDCRLLCINSGQEGVVECKENLWVHYKNDASISQGVSCLLSIDDINEIRDNMLDFSSKHIIPHMEQKVRILNQQVSATRKGFRNQIKNLWWRKGKEDAPDAPNAPSYTFSSIESQIRVLGDYAFMLRDYELALSNYRLLSTDYKLDKAWKRYAGVQEMVGLSLFLLDQSRKDAEYCMENAFNTYLRVGASGQRNATRCGIWWAEMLKARGQLKEAAGVYFRISNEEPSLHAAVMLEKASYCFLCSNPPMLRKYGFHLVMAGNRYYVSDQRKYAIRAYRNALPVYEGNAWNYINDHVHFNIGRWYASLGMFDKAIKHMLEVLACTHQSLVTQDLFLSDFLRIIQDVGKKYEVLELQLPIINMSSLRIMFEDHRTYASSSAVHVRESLWHSLEEDMVPSVATAKFNWLESQSKLSSLKKHNDTNICVVGEAIKLFLEFKNPLQISISISGVSLLCELSTGSAATVVDESKSATDTLHSGVFCGNRGLDSDNSSFVTSELNFVLGGDETRGVQLDVTPKMEGYLKVLGVKWTLSDSVSGYHYFDFNLSKKKHRKGRGVGHSSIHNLTFTVVKSLPKLEGYIHHMPRKTYTGDLQLLMLELKNQSEHTVKNVKMKISHPRFLIPGSLEDMNSEFPGCLKKQISFEHKDMHETFMEKSKGLPYSFPNDAAIQGGAIFLWPLWLHAGASGNVSLYISIYYEVDNFYSDIKYRTLRMHYELEVLPSLELSILITPGPSSLREFLVHMDIVNRTSSKSFWLHQLSSVGCQWDISSLQAYVSFCPSPLLLAGQALSCFFKLKDCGESSLNENKFTIHGSDARLGSQDDNEALFDVTRSPLANFHFHERSLQRKPLKGCPSQVDFILISKLVGDDANLEQGEPPRLFSHHACHCSVTKNSPIWWLMDGPRSIDHDFSVSFCEARFHMTIRNCSAAIAFVKITTFDAMPNSEQPSDVSPVSDSNENQVVGWHDVSLVNDMAVVISDVRGTQFKKPSPPRSIISPFVWCSSSSTQVKLEPLSSAEIPLRICAFSPGTYDLSNYEVHWSLQLVDDAKGFTKDDVTRQSSGTIGGHPFYITILQSQP